MKQPLDSTNSRTDNVKSVSLPQKPFNINQNYFLHIDHRTVPLDLDRTYFAPAELRGDGLFFRIDKDVRDRAAGSAYQTNPADDSTDNIPNYEDHD